MRKSMLVSLSIFALVAVFALSASIASAAKTSEEFVLGSVKVGSAGAKLAKPVSGVISLPKAITVKSSKGRPTIKIVYSKLENNAAGLAGITATVVIHFKGASPDKREVTMTIPVKLTVDAKGKFSGVSIPGPTTGDNASWTGTTSAGTPVLGNMRVGSDVFTGKAKTLSINSDALLTTLEGDIGTIGKEVGSYTFDITITGTGLLQKYKKEAFTKLSGTLTVK